MKIDKVLLSSNNNKSYTVFWNTVSFVWKTKFNITPVLVFYGTVEEFNSNNFDFTYGEYIILEKFTEISDNGKDWVPTWSLFFAASKFEDEICMTSGIDQIPITNLFFNEINDINNEKLIIGFADAYKNYVKTTLGYFNIQTNLMYPSSHLVSKGSKFKKIFDISDNWSDEIHKVYDNRNRFYLTEGCWGLDECYASEKISNYINQDEIHYMDLFWKFWHPNRIDIDAQINANYSLEKIKNGEYSEFTTKSFFQYENQINEVIKNISEYGII